MKTRFLAALAVTAVLPFAPPAAATSTRLWVSGHGVDQSGCGSPASPCRSLQYAETNVASGGEIDILDPAGYGAITIGKAVSIINDGVGTAGVQATSGDAITISAASGDAVVLRGLNIDGVHSSGANGIAFSSGGSLTVMNCVISHFSQNGINITSSGNATPILISGAVITDVGSGSAGQIYAALNFRPSAPLASSDSVVVDHSVFASSLVGLAVQGGTVRFAISNTLLANSTYGAYLIGDPSLLTDLTFDASGVVGNQFGIDVQNTPVVHLSRSLISQNAVDGILNQATAGGVVYSTGDNRIDGNGFDVVGALTPELLQ